MITVNKYIVQMYEHGKDAFTRAKGIIATSEWEAIKKLIDDPFWYNEGVGYEYVKLEYPLTFKAKINNG